MKQYAWAFPAFKKPAGVTDANAIDLSALSDDEMALATEVLTEVLSPS